MSKESFHKLANEYVNQIEEEHNLGLLQEHAQAHKAAEGCGCDMCKKWEARVVGLIYDEAVRLCPPGRAKVYEAKRLPDPVRVPTNDDSWDSPSK